MWRGKMPPPSTYALGLDVRVRSAACLWGCERVVLGEPSSTIACQEQPYWALPFYYPFAELGLLYLFFRSLTYSVYRNLLLRALGPATPCQQMVTPYPLRVSCSGGWWPSTFGTCPPHHHTFSRARSGWAGWHCRWVLMGEFVCTFAKAYIQSQGLSTPVGACRLDTWPVGVR